MLHLETQERSVLGFDIILLHAKRAEFSVTFSRCRTKFHLDMAYGTVLTAACECLLFEKVRFENNLIFLYFMDAKCIKFFI